MLRPKRAGASSQEDRVLHTMRRSTGIVILSLIVVLAGVEDGRPAAKAAPAGSQQLTPELQAMAVRVREQEEAAKRAKANADRLAEELAALLESDKRKASEATDPTGSSAGPGGITAADVDTWEAEAERLTAIANQLEQELATLRRARLATEDQLRRARDRAAQAGAARDPKARSAADLEEELARAEQALKAAEQQAAAQRQALRRIRERIGKAQEPLDIARGRVPGTAWQPESSIEFVCRREQIAFLDNQPLLARCEAEIRELAAEDKTATWDDAETRINNLKLEGAVCTLSVKAVPGNLLIQLRMKFNEQWESIDRMEAENSSFRAMLASADASSTGLTFVVWDDSFETYIRAVTIAKEAGFRTNWIPYDADEEIDFVAFSTGSQDSGGGPIYDPRGG